MRKYIFFLFINLNLFLLVPLGNLLTGCNTTDPKLEPDLKLELKDVSCTEAWLQLTTNNIQLPATINLLTNNTVAQVFNLSTQDSLLYIDSLLPNQNYSFQVSSIQNPVSSNKVTATTMDTTSHNFTWQTFEFGVQTNVSRLFDVAIINENNIWAVGEIYMNDSLGNPDPTCYNAVHWDGQSWELKSIYYYGACSAVTYPPLTAIWTFDANSIVVTNGGSIGWFNGTNINLDCRVNPLLTGAINKIWGSNSNDLYAVGNNGNIAHYNGSSWTKIESGTTTDIQDVLGFKDAFTSETSVYCAVSYVFQNGDRKILQIKSNTVDSLNWMGDKRINSIWTSNNKFFFTAGDGVFENKRGYWNQVIDLPPYYSNNIRGNDLNDVFVCGDFGLLSHFNGSSWFTYNEHYMHGILFSVATKNNIVVTVGLDGNKATIIKGTRN